MNNQFISIHYHYQFHQAKMRNCVCCGTFAWYDDRDWDKKSKCAILVLTKPNICYKVDREKKRCLSQAEFFRSYVWLNALKWNHVAISSSLQINFRLFHSQRLMILQISELMLYFDIELNIIIGSFQQPLKWLDQNAEFRVVLD